MVNKLIRIDDETDEKIKYCIDDFLRHHPELKKIKISYNKIIFEIARFYLKM